MSSDKAREGQQAVSRPSRRRTRPGRIILGWLVAYAIALAVLCLTGYEQALPALCLPVGGLAGYAVGYFASRSSGRRGETIANLFFFSALGMLMIMAVFIVVSRPAEASDPCG
jgi:hypothetical protein